MAFAHMGASTAMPPRHQVPQETLFFMIQPDEAATARIATLMETLQRALDLPQHQVAPDRFHISLHNLGKHAATPPELIARGKRIAEGLRIAPFDVALDRVLSFQGRETAPLVLTDAGEETPLKAFWNLLGNAIRESALGNPARAGFRPHVTLMYPRPRILETRIDPIAWTVRELILVKNLVGQGRRIHLGRWALTA
jgi:RNA 2',3'-cyclic 3'-phosphodiesterase